MIEDTADLHLGTLGEMNFTSLSLVVVCVLLSEVLAELSASIPSVTRGSELTYELRKIQRARTAKGRGTFFIHTCTHDRLTTS